MLAAITREIDVCEFQHEFCGGHHWNRRISMGCKVIVAGTWWAVVNCFSFREKKDMVEEEKGACGGLMD
jgi:hypothetical protein